MLDPSVLMWCLLLFIFPLFYLLIGGGEGRERRRKLPPGSMGIPVIGQSLQLLQAMRANTAEKWVEERVSKYGPVSKLSLFGKPTVLVKGPAANKMIFSGRPEVLSNEQTQSIQRILGERNLLALQGEDHRRVRGALMSFLRPEVLKDYVPKIDIEVRKHLDRYWRNQSTIKVMPLMKTLTFDILSSLLFGLEEGSLRRDLAKGFEEMILGMWAVPINLPLTRFNRSLKASKRVQSMIRELVGEKREALRQARISPQSDLFTCLLSTASRSEDSKEAGMSEQEIIDDVTITMVAGHDTSSVVMTFLIRLLANEPQVLANVLREQEEIAKGKVEGGEPLTWNDLSKMKYTWRVTTELLRLIPPVFGGFRQVLMDIEYEGYLIPKGWQIFWVTSLTQLDEAIFPEPRKFDASRFDGQTLLTPYSWVAFGGGPRICPGNEFARLEILTAIHHMVTQFEWKLCCKEDTYRRDPLPVPNQGLPILLQEKKI